ncbi:MAG: alpha/beta hydrolase [Chloroflexi bacterium]|nr:MAG: alpha/beta hydrolase [Chloroflexota bacterium]
MKVWHKILVSILVFLLLAALVGPFLIPVTPSGEATERDLADLDSKFIEVNGLTVHYKEVGQGEKAIILLHGFGASVFSWHKVMEPLAMFGRVIAYDRPAFGLTSRPMPGEWSGESPYSMEANVLLLAGLIEALGIEKATLMGNSAGGGVAVAFALAYPQRIESLILVDPAVGNASRFPAWALPLMRSPQAQRFGPLLVRDIASSGNDTIRLAWHEPAKISQDTFDGYRKPLRANNWDRALWEFTIAARPLNLADRLGELAMPVLVISGDDDRIVPTQSSIDLADKIPGAVLRIIPGCGHVPHEEKPAEFVQLVQDFMDELK